MRQSSKVIQRAFLVLQFLSLAARAQAPTGTIAGNLSDAAGAVVSTANITLSNPITGFTRTATTGAHGDYSFSSLLPGEYQLTVEVQGFRPLSRAATVEAGTTTTVDLVLLVGTASDTVTVSGAAPQMQYEEFHTGGVVLRQQIESLPLNGRNFLELAKLEPGVTTPARQPVNRTTVPILGAPRFGNLTRVTVDGGSISLITSPGPVLGLSQEAVQEFQIATANAGVATGTSGTGLVNIVTRSGNNELHGSVFMFFRDHHLAAYPGLQRDPSNPDPFFQRRQWGGQLGGPIRRDRAFFFVNFETNDQRSVIGVQPAAADLALLGGIFKNAYLGRQLTARFDLNLNEKNSGFMRYSHDNNTSFAPAVGAGNLPSNWSRLPYWVDQSLIALTTVLTPHLVNDLRLSCLFVSTPEQPPGPSDCPNCIGLHSPGIVINQGVTLGNARVFSNFGRRYQVSDALSWQRGPHRMHFGFEWEYSFVSHFRVENEPATLTLYSPEQVRQYNAGVDPQSQIPLPASFRTLDDILQLPLQSFVTDIGSGRTMQPDFSKWRRFDTYRVYAEDVWHVRSRLALSYGLAWSYEPHNLNYDLTRPNYLAPILGADHLAPPQASRTHFSPSAGFAWSVTHDAKTVLRGGVGLYYDPQMPGWPALHAERTFLGPLGTGRTSFKGSSLNYNGETLDFPAAPTRFTAAQLLAILPAIRTDLSRGRDPNNRDLSVRNIELAKQGQDIFAPDFTAPYAIHTSIGIQREIAPGFVIGADYVRRRFVHTLLSGIDLNHFNAAGGPVLPKGCTDAQRSDPKALCSLGAIMFDLSSGVATYNGLLVRAERRFPQRLQLLASYALSTDVGTGTGGAGFNLFDWSQNYGPLDTDQRHVLSISGILDLPRKFQLSFSAQYYSKPPFTAVVGGIDLIGDGIRNKPLPGTKVNQFNRGLGKHDLERLVADFNATYAGKKDAGGKTTIPRLTLPAKYDFNSPSFTLDQRISRTWTVRERWRLTFLGEVFNLFNVANLGGYSNKIDSKTFGQPTTRVDQAFGSGGPRSFQLAVRVSF